LQSAQLRIGTRGSPLALAQAHETQDRLCRATGRDETQFALKVIKTTGDAIQGRSRQISRWTTISPRCQATSRRYRPAVSDTAFCQPRTAPTWCQSLHSAHPRCAE